jgi:cysteine desulfurase
MYGNPSSMHASGRRAHRALQDARARIADCVGAFPDEIIFTGSGTESDNLALIGAARANSAHGKHILISAIEHKAILEAARVLEGEGFEISRIPVDSEGLIDVHELHALVRDDTILVSIMLANNEIGSILPIAKLTKSLSTRRARTGFPLIHTDACQAIGYEKIDVRTLDVDLLTLNSTKAYGPKGVGMLYKKRGVPITPLIVGGEQEKGLRAGTEALPLVVGMAAAFLKAEKLREAEVVRLSRLRTLFIKELKKRIPHIIINGSAKHHLPHIVHVTVPHIEGESMVLMLDSFGIEVATGSACSAHDLKPSHVQRATGQRGDLLHGSVRFSLGRGTTHDELEYVLKIFSIVTLRLSRMSALTTREYIYGKNKTTV